VALAQLRKLTAALAQPPGSVADLPARLESERLVAAGALAAMLDRLQLEGVPAQLAAQIESLDQQAVSGRPTHEFARERVRERLLDVRARWKAARGEATPESLHRARIGNKRLRYAIEPFSRMLGKQVRRLYRSAVAVSRRARRCPRRGFDGGDARDRHGRRSQGERRAWERLSVRVIRGRRVALRKALSLADELEPLWDEAQRAVEVPPH